MLGDPIKAVPLIRSIRTSLTSGLARAAAMSGGKGVPKSKWSTEEEEALKVGVERHGPGKWRLIQKDDELSPLLKGRSNVDLKDKWRNLTVGSNSSTPKRARKEKPEGELAATPPANVLSPQKLQELVMDAVTALKDKNGSNQTSMTKYVESNLEPGLALPPAFKKHLADALQHLVDIGALVKNKTLYKLPGGVDGDGAAATPKTAKVAPGSGKKERGAATAATAPAAKAAVAGDAPRASKAARVDASSPPAAAVGSPGLDEMKRSIEKKKKEIVKMKNSKKFGSAHLGAAEHALEAALAAVRDAEDCKQTADVAAREAKQAEREAQEAANVADAAAQAVLGPVKEEAPTEVEAAEA